MRPKVKEADVSFTIQDGLSKMGYRVFSTTVRGFYGGANGKGYGITKGVTDLLIGSDEWGPVLLPLEVKGPKTPLSSEQKDLYSKGLIYVARSWEEAIAAVDNFEQLFGFARRARRAMN